MQSFIFGVPVVLPEGAPPYKPYRGSVQVTADCCGAIVWQGPAQQLLKSQQPELQIICAWCAVKMLKAEGYTYEQAVQSVVSLTDKKEGE